MFSARESQDLNWGPCGWRAEILPLCHPCDHRHGRKKGFKFLCDTQGSYRVLKTLKSGISKNFLKSMEKSGK